MDQFTEALQKEFKTKKFEQIDTTGSEFQTPEVPEEKKDNKAEAPKEVKPEDKKPEVLSNIDSPKEEKKAEVKAEEIQKVPEFEEILAERTGGKFKSWDEIEAKINEPKTEFANEQIQKINDFVKNGGKIDSDWLYFQQTDFTKIEDPFELVSEAMRLAEPGITDAEIEYRLKTEYKTEDWSAEGEEPNEVESAMTAKLAREANNARAKLIEHKEKTSFNAPQKTEEQLKKEQEISKSIQQNWEKNVEETAKTFDKIAVKIDDKEAFDVIVSEDERKAIIKMSKQMGKEGLNVLLPKFLDKKGNIDLKLLQNYMYKAENFDNAVKAAAVQYLAKGRLEVAKDVKNINFKPDSSTEAPKSKSISESIAESVLKNGMH